MPTIQIVIFVAGALLLAFATWLFVKEMRRVRVTVEPEEESPFGDSERPSRLRRRLAQTYLPFLEELVGGEQAKDRFEEIFFQACNVARALRRDRPATDDVEAMLRREKTDSVLRLSLASKRADGVLDDDLRWWGGLHIVEKRVILKLLEFRHAATWQHIKVVGGGTADQVAATVKERLPVFAEGAENGDPNDSHRPLAIEMWYRVTRVMSTLSREDRLELEAEAKRLGSMNALLREWSPFLAKATIKPLG